MTTRLQDCGCLTNHSILFDVDVERLGVSTSRRIELDIWLQLLRNWYKSICNFQWLNMVRQCILANASFAINCNPLIIIIWCTQWVSHFHLSGYPPPPFHLSPAQPSPAACTSPVRNQPAHAGLTSPDCQLAQAHNTSLQLATTSSDNNTLLWWGFGDNGYRLSFTLTMAYYVHLSNLSR